MAGFLQGLASSAAQMGFGMASSEHAAKLTRELRRNEYQDMMHSMKEAGLNPMLAMGQSPGHATASPTSGPDVGGNIASAQESSRRERLNPAQERLLQAQEQTALATAREAEAKAVTAETLRDAQLDELRNKANLTGAQADIEQARSIWRDTLASTEAYRAVNELEQSRQRTAANLPAVIRDQRQAEAGLAAAREVGQRARNVPAEVEARYMTEFETLVKSGMAADDISKVMGPGMDIVRSVLSRGFSLGKAKNRSRRESGNSAKGGSTLPGAGRDQLPADHPRRYSKDEFGNFVDKHTGEVLKEAP